MSSLKDRKSFRIEVAPPTAVLPGSRAGALPEIVIGTIVRLAADGAPEVDFPGNPAAAPIAALTTAACDAGAVGCEAALLFVDGDPGRPLIVGLVRRPGETAAPVDGPSPATPSEARLDGDRIVLSADREIELRCGKASLILTRAGKVLIRGAYLLSRSSGANRIKGGSVQIN